MRDVLALLEWYRAAGIDATVADKPTDWLTRGNTPPGHAYRWPNDERASAPALNERNSDPARAPASMPAKPTLSERPRAQTPLAASEAESEGRRIAKAAATLDELATALADFNGCSLKATAKKLCFYRGAPTSRLMLIGEAPGREEDLEGKPFVGRAGQLLDRMLTAIGLTEADVHITNVVYWRPPGNRTPTPQETLACRPFLDRQMEFVRPDLVVALGSAAAKEVLGVTEGIMRLRGKWREIAIAGRPVNALATLHPAYLLRTPAAKQLAWLDLLQIRAALADL